jgi:hypothetical protein
MTREVYNKLNSPDIVREIKVGILECLRMDDEMTVKNFLKGSHSVMLFVTEIKTKSM